MIIVKLITTLFIQLDFWNSVKDIVLSPFDSPKLELVMVVLVIPFVVNVKRNVITVSSKFIVNTDLFAVIAVVDDYVLGD